MLNLTGKRRERAAVLDPLVLYHACEGVSSRPGAPLKSHSACARAPNCKKRVTRQKRSGKQLWQHCRCGHMDMHAARAATVGCSSGPTDRRTTTTSDVPNVPEHCGTASEREEKPARKEAERWRKPFWSPAVTVALVA